VKPTNLTARITARRALIEAHEVPASLRALDANNAWQRYVAGDYYRYSHPGMEPVALRRAALIAFGVALAIAWLAWGAL
jgi:hypothetical protein